MRLLPVAAALALGLAAAPSRAFDCPDRGGATWREVTTGHFVVHTDLSSRKARALARELERLHEAVRHGLFLNPPPSPERVRVVVFDDADDYATFAPKNASAYYLRSTSLGPTVVMPGGLGDAQRSIIAHELTHHFTARVFARRPTWFSEGLATVMETVGSSGIENLPTVGGVPRHRYVEVYPYHGGIGPVLAARGALSTSREYALAWALVHMLFNTRGKELADLQLRFVRGQDPVAAWRAVFPEWDPANPGGVAALDKAVGRYVARGSFAYREVRLPPEGPVSERTLGAAEAHAVRLTLPRFDRGETADAPAILAEVEETLAHDPGNVAALAAAARIRPAEALALAERATASAPGDVRAWLLLAGALPEAEAERREAALRKAVEVAPGHAGALNELAWFLLLAGRSGEGLPHARAAAAAAPWDAAVLDTLAGVLEDLGQCAPALAVQQRATDALPEGLSARAREPYEERLARLEGQCGAAKAAAP
jgi:tetratricopeptide (TPR) repeat protein